MAMADLRKQHRVCTSVCVAVPETAASPGSDSGMHRASRYSALERLSSGDQSMIHVWRMCSGSEFFALRRVSWTLYRSSLRPGNGATLECDQANIGWSLSTTLPVHALTIRVNAYPRQHIVLYSDVALARQLGDLASLRSLHLHYLKKAGAVDLAPFAKLIGLREFVVHAWTGTELIHLSSLEKLKHLERLDLKASPFKQLVVPPSVRELDVAVTCRLVCEHPESLVVVLPQLAVLSLHVSEFPVSLWSEIVDRGTRLHTLRLYAQRSVSSGGRDARPKNPRTAALTHLDLEFSDSADWPDMLLPTLRHLAYRSLKANDTPGAPAEPFTRACPAALETCLIGTDSGDNGTPLCRTLDCLLAGPSVHSLRGLDLLGMKAMDLDLSCLQSCSALRRLQVDGISNLPRMPGLTDLSIGSAFTKPLHKQVEQLVCNMPGLIVLRISWLTPDPCVHVLSQLPWLRHLALVANDRSDISDSLNRGFCKHGACPSGASLHFPSLRLVQVNWTCDAEAQWINQCAARGITVSNYIPTWSVHGTHDTG